MGVFNWETLSACLRKVQFFSIWCVHNLWTKTDVKIVFEQTCALPIAKYKERKNGKCVQNCEN